VDPGAKGATGSQRGGKRTFLVDFPKFALCGHHGHLLRQEGVRVYRYGDECEREEGFAKEREAQEMKWAPFAERFKTPGNDANKSRKPSGDGRHVGQGLGKLSKDAAEKRKSKEQKSETKPNGSAVPPPEPKS
jgi:hypothetical protein